jgi:hypothetical protein
MIRLTLIPIILFALTCLSPSQIRAQTRPTALTATGAPTDFDFLIGDWDIDVETQAPGRPSRYRGRWTATRAYNGRLIVDEFRALDDQGTVRNLSITYRIFNESVGRWLMSFINLDNKAWQDAEGARVGHEVHVRQWFRGPRGEDGVLRIRYTDITPESFLWRMDRSLDGGATWDVDYQIMRARRRPASSVGG